MRNTEKKLLSCVALMLLTISAFSQADVNIRRGDFKMKKDGFAEAWKHITQGDNYYKKKGLWYGNAYQEYILAIAYNGSNNELNYKTGVSALFSDHKESASAFFLKALAADKPVANDIYLLTGRALQYSGDFKQAIEKYNAYLSNIEKKDDEKGVVARRCIEECNYAIEIVKDTLAFVIENMGTVINSSSDDFAVVPDSEGDTLFYASKRALSKSGSPNPDARYDENIFISKLVNGAWDSPVVASKKLTTDNSESPVCLNKTSDTLYIYAGYENGGDIKYSKFRNGEWKSPESVTYGINTYGNETSMTIHPSGAEICFVTTDYKDNKGGKDIYTISKLNGKKWSKPRNLGESVNTRYDEESVRYSASGDTLWFSSKGHNTMGGFDVFYSVRNVAGEWDAPVNAGYPVNSQWDELFFVPVNKSGLAFYMVSNRAGGTGGLDLYTGRRK